MPAASNKPTLNRALAVGLLVAIAGGVFLVAFTFFRKGGLAARDSYAVTRGLRRRDRPLLEEPGPGGRHPGRRGHRDRALGRAGPGDHPHQERHPAAGQRLPDQALPVGAAARRAARGQRGHARPRRCSATSRTGSGEITCVREAANVAKLMESLSKIAGDIQVVSADLAKTVGGTQGSVREIIENLTHVTRSVDQLLDENSGEGGGHPRQHRGPDRRAARGGRPGRRPLLVHRQERRRGQPAPEPHPGLGRGHRRPEPDSRAEGVGPGRAAGPPEAQQDPGRRPVGDRPRWRPGRAWPGSCSSTSSSARRSAWPPRTSPTT